MATTIKPHAHPSLSSFVAALVESAKNGDFYDLSMASRAWLGSRPYSSFPTVELTSSKTRPKGSGLVAESGDTLYSSFFPLPLGVFLNDVQLAVAGGAHDGKEFGALHTVSARTKPFFIGNVTFEAPALVDIKVAKADLTVAFAGEDGSGTASVTKKPAHTTTRLSKASGLSNGDTVTVTVTAADGYTVNGKASVTFDFTVSGLTATPAAV